MRDFQGERIGRIFLSDKLLGVSITPTAVPEPGSIALLVGLSVTGAGFLRKRRHSK